MNIWLKAVATVGALMAAAPAASSTSVVIIDFDSMNVGETSFSFDAFGDPFFQTDVTGGTVITATPADPAQSGDQVYQGLEISFALTDPINYSWPGIGAYVSGASSITLRLWAYDMGTGMDVEVFSGTVGPSAAKVFLGGGDAFNPGAFTRGEFSSATPFSIDDLTFGIEGVAPGIPEPASWAMMIGGLACAGAAMRRGRARLVVAA